MLASPTMSAGLWPLEMDFAILIVYAGTDVDEVN